MTLIYEEVCYGPLISALRLANWLLFRTLLAMLIAHENITFFILPFILVSFRDLISFLNCKSNISFSDTLSSSESTSFFLSEDCLSTDSSLVGVVNVVLLFEFTRSSSS